MKSIISKYYLKIFFLIFLAGIFLCSATSVTATAPHIKGYVLNYYTKEPVPNVYVKWHDRYENPASRGTYGERYEVTDGDGFFFFRSWQSRPDHEEANRSVLCATDMDTNLDGIIDGKQTSFFGLNRPCAELAGFGCGENPHKISVVKPVNWNGEFVSENGDGFVLIPDMKNTSGQKVVNFFWKPNAPAKCDCDDLLYSGKFEPGGTVSYISRYKVPDLTNNSGTVSGIEFTMKLNDAVISSEVINPEYSVSGNNGIYEAKIDYTIPLNGFGTSTYLLEVNGQCVQRTAWQEILKYKLASYLDLFRMEVSAQEPTIKEICSSVGKNSLQLCTFIPQVIEKTCTSSKFTITYN